MALGNNARNMGNVVSFFDGLRNAITGAGTARDARSANSYAFTPLTQYDIECAYRGSGLLRKVINIPALDMVREWREWSGLNADEAAKVYDTEKRFGIRQKIKAAEVLRGLGGGALILGLPGDPALPAPVNAPLAYLHVVSRWHLTYEQLEQDARLPSYGEPTMWTMAASGGQVRLHPSRVIPFRADTAGLLASTQVGAHDLFWGDSTVAQVLDAVRDSDAARAAFAGLMHKARTLRLGIPRLSERLAEPDGLSKVQTRLSTLVLAESTLNAFVYDAGDDDGNGGETITDSAYTFAGAKDVLNAYGEFVAAISDIPATRLLGRAPEGMNSSGESQQKDWAKKVRAMQTIDLAPCLDRLDQHLLPAALGSYPATASYEFAPLDLPSEKERTDRFKVAMEAAEKLQLIGAVPEQALNRGVQSLLVEEGYLPELEAALAEMGEDERYGAALPDDEVETDPVAPAAEQLADATPRPLYVHRKLLNGADLAAWAKANGFETTLPAEDMHATVLYSRRAVDPMKLGETWSGEEDGGLIIKPGGPRAIEQFDGGAVVLQFASWSLQSRHREMVEAGGSHDYGEYLPHVTLTYSAPEGVDLTALRPYAGELRFGPEVFEPLDEDWKSKIEEA